MGFSLADFGLVSSGMNAELDAGTRRRRDEEDRQYQLEQRKRQEEAAIAAQDELRRKIAYDTEVRATLPKYLAGGEQGIPATPAQDAVVLDPRQQEGGDTSQPAREAKPAQTNYADMYKDLQSVATKHGRLGDYEAMRGKLKTFQDEGLLDFVKKAYQGAGEQELMDTFNATGKVKLTGLRRVPGDQNEFAAVTADGTPTRINVDTLLESVLPPKELVAHHDRSERTAAVAAATEGRLKAQRDALDANAGRREAEIGLKEAQAAMARARADATTAGDGTGRPRSAGSWNQYDKEVRSLATTHLTAPDPETGKPVLDRKNLVQLTSMAGVLARQSPELSPGEAVQAAAAKMDEIRSIQDQSTAEAETAAKTLSFDSPRQRDAWIKNTAERRAKARTEAASTTPTQEAPASTAAPPSAAAKPAAPGVAEPKSQADFDALAPGTRYVNPSDGRIYVKK